MKLPRGKHSGKNSQHHQSLWLYVAPPFSSSFREGTNTCTLHHTPTNLQSWEHMWQGHENAGHTLDSDLCHEAKLYSLRLYTTLNAPVSTVPNSRGTKMVQGALIWAWLSCVLADYCSHQGNCKPLTMKTHAHHPKHPSTLCTLHLGVLTPSSSFIVALCLTFLG